MVEVHRRWPWHSNLHRFADLFFRILQKRTESNLIDHESQLKHHAKQLSNAESQFTLTESNRRDVCHDIMDLKSEISRLSATNECLQKEKDRLIVSSSESSLFPQIIDCFPRFLDEIGRKNRESLCTRIENGIVTWAFSRIELSDRHR